MTKADCQVCGAISSSILDYSVMIHEYRGFKAPLPLFFQDCEFCGESAGQEESKLNKDVVLAFFSDVDLYYELEEVESNEN